MTKKGFDYEECYLKFDGEIFAIAENKKNAKVIGETLIQLFNENEQLKERIEELKKEINSLSYGEADWLIDEELWLKNNIVDNAFILQIFTVRKLINKWVTAVILVKNLD